MVIDTDKFALHLFEHQLFLRVKLFGTAYQSMLCFDDQVDQRSLNHKGKILHLCPGR